MTGVLEGLDALFERLDARLGLFDLVSVLVNSGVLVGFQDVPEDDFEGAGELLEKVGVLLLALEVLVVVFEEASVKRNTFAGRRRVPRRRFCWKCCPW